MIKFFTIVKDLTALNGIMAALVGLVGYGIGEYQQAFMLALVALMSYGAYYQLKQMLTVFAEIEKEDKDNE